MDRYEVEVKLACTHDRVRPHLLATGFEDFERVRQVDRYFAAPYRSFELTDEALRVRHERDLEGEREATYLTYKGPRRGRFGQARLETTVEVADPERMTELLTWLDFIEVGTVDKVREGFERDAALATLDTVDGLGEYLEVELSATATGIDTSESALEAILQELSLGDREPVHRTYLELQRDAQE